MDAMSSISHGTTPPATPPLSPRNPRRRKSSILEEEVSSIRVAVRVRPFSKKEKAAGARRIVEMHGNSTVLTDPTMFLHLESADAGADIEGIDNDDVWRTQFTFDRCFWSFDRENPNCKHASQREVFDTYGPWIIENAAHGFNCSLFAYGQTGSGKTHTMMGNDVDISANGDAGFIPRLCSGIFKEINLRSSAAAGGHGDEADASPARAMFKSRHNRTRSASVSSFGSIGLGISNTADQGPSSPRGQGPRGKAQHASSFHVEASYFEIYNERVFDLLNPNNKMDASASLRVREHPKTGAYVEDLLTIAVSSYHEIEELLKQGSTARRVAETRMNKESSRSHAVFQLVLRKQRDGGGGGGGGENTDGIDSKRIEQSSRLYLVDLAGSERVSASGATGARLKEAANINRSLSALSDVIKALTTPRTADASGKQFVPYRNSALTWLLKESLGGNAKTVMLATVSPDAVNYHETLSTLKYAERAKKIVNKARVNKESNAALVEALQQEIHQLREQLARYENEASDVMSPSSRTLRANQAAVDRRKLLVRLESQEKLVSKLSTSWEQKRELAQEHFAELETQNEKLQRERAEMELEMQRLRLEKVARDAEEEKRKLERQQRQKQQIEQQLLKRKQEQTKQQSAQRELEELRARTIFLEEALEVAHTERDAATAECGTVKRSLARVEKKLAKQSQRLGARNSKLESLYRVILENQALVDTTQMEESAATSFSAAVSPSSQGPSDAENPGTTSDDDDDNDDSVGEEEECDETGEDARDIEGGEEAESEKYDNQAVENEEVVLNERIDDAAVDTESYGISSESAEGASETLPVATSANAIAARDVSEERKSSKKEKKASKKASKKHRKKDETRASKKSKSDEDTLDVETTLRLQLAHARELETRCTHLEAYKSIVEPLEHALGPEKRELAAAVEKIGQELERDKNAIDRLASFKEAALESERHFREREAKLQGDIETANGNLASVEQRLEAKTKEIDELRAELAAMRAEGERAEAEQGHLQTHIEAMTRELELKKTMAEALETTRQELADTTAKLSKTADDLGAAREELSDARTSLKKTTEDLGAAREELGNVHQELERAKGQFAEVHEGSKIHKNQLAHVQGELDEARDQCEVLRGQLHEARAARDAAEVARSETLASLETAEAKARERGAENDELRATVSGLEEELAAQAASAERARDEVERQREQTAHMRELHANEMRGLEAQTASLDADRAALSARLEDAHKELEDARKELEKTHASETASAREWVAKCAEKDSEIEELEEQLRAQQQGFEIERKELNLSVATALSQLSVMQGNFRVLEKSSRTANSVRERELDALDARADTLLREKAQLEGELRSKAEECDRWRTSEMSAIKANSRLEMELLSVKDQVSFLRETETKLREQVAALTKAKQMTAQQLHTVEQSSSHEVTSLKRSLRELQSETEALRQQLENERIAFDTIFKAQTETLNYSTFRGNSPPPEKLRAQLLKGRQCTEKK